MFLDIVFHFGHCNFRWHIIGHTPDMPSHLSRFISTTLTIGVSTPVKQNITSSGKPKTCALAKKSSKVRDKWQKNFFGMPIYASFGSPLFLSPRIYVPNGNIVFHGTGPIIFRKISFQIFPAAFRQTFSGASFPTHICKATDLM
jgi:hypothetical protein